MRVFQRLQSVWTAAAVLCACSSRVHADDVAPKFVGERILISAKINQQSAVLLFDTGATFTAIFEKSAPRLQAVTEATREVKIGNRPLMVGQSQPLDLEMLGQKVQQRLPIVPLAAEREIDGVFSWQNFTTKYLLIDGYERIVRTPNQLPAAGWQRWSLDDDSQQLFFVVTKGGERLGRVFVDTGANFGLRLSPVLWKAWREQHPQAGITLEPFRYSVGEVLVHELSWADEYRLGDLLIQQVDIGPIPESRIDQAVDLQGKDFIATIGFRALRHLRLIINRPGRELLTQSVSPLPNHNRLGAVFVRGITQNSPYVAQVLAGSPADRHGLKNGDELVGIDGVDFSDISQTPAADPTSFFSRPAGTQLEIKVSRNGENHMISVVLEDILRLPSGENRTP